MKIVNSIMPISDMRALAANGQKLRVAVTKTSAQGKSAQSATPNLMSFSTDENSIWFNGKKYGVYILKGFENLKTGVNTSVIQSFLGDFTYDRWVDAVNTGNIVFVKANNILIPASVYASNSENLNITFVTPTYTYLVSIHYSTGSGYSIDMIQQDSLVRATDVNNTLTNSSTDKPLSAAMGKKLQDEKLAKTDVVNNLTTTDTSKALSAAQGKALNDRISGLGNVYRVKGTKTNLSDVLALTDAKVGDVWNVTNAFTLGGKPYPANTNIVCITATSSSNHGEGNWDPLGGTVDLGTYVPKSDIVDNLSTSDSKKPLSAKQGLALATMITELEDDKETYQLLKTFESSTPSSQGEVDAILGPYSSFNAALNAGKIIHGIYKDGSNRLNTVAFSAFNDTTANRVRMHATLNSSTMVTILANHNGTNWTSATIDEGPLGGGITIE
jgi:hypothetical protein